MKLTRYTKFNGDLSTSFDLEDLMEALSDFFLDSGFQDPYSPFQNNGDNSMEDLREAVRQALDSGDPHLVIRRASRTILVRKALTDMVVCLRRRSFHQMLQQGNP